MDEQQKRNPYEPPDAIPPESSKPTSPFWTQNRVFWIGVGLIILAVAGLNMAHPAFVKSQTWRSFVIAGNLLAGIALIIGLSCIVVYHWFPDPQGRKPWHRRK